MKRWNSGIKVGFALMAAWTLSGCVTGPLYKEAGGIGGGYRDKQLSPNTFWVYFVGDSYENALYSAAYRSAELTYSHKFRYFIITKDENMSQAGHQNPGNPGENMSAWGVVRIYIKCFHEKPNVKKWYDCNVFLNEDAVPYEKAPYTIAQRKADLRKGIHNWEEREEQNQDK